jgi:LemA protein
MPTWLIVVLVIVVLLVLWVISTYNSLVSLRNKVKDQWAQIDTVLKRRFDLIPNLVETVKGYAKHESETLEAVIAARNTYVSANAPEDQMKADGELTKAISKLFALSEAYPELKANENFNSLQKELSETEDKIQYARQFYNDIVRKYNTKRETFPTVLIAGMLGFKEVNFFEASAEERQNVQVKF